MAHMWCALILCLLLGTDASFRPQEPPARRGNTQEGLDVQGHRGCRGLLPENSLPAFREAISLGVTTIEMDLQLTRDEVVVVHHDARLDPTRCSFADGRAIPRQPIRTLRYEDLRGIDCGRGRSADFSQQRLAPAEIPVFPDVLEVVRAAGRPVRMNVEIKRHDPERDAAVPRFVEIVLRMVEEYGLADRTMVESFDPDVLLEVARVDPRIRRGILVRQRGDYERSLARSGADTLLPRLDGLREEDVKRFQARGLRVVPWTINETQDIRRLLDWGVDGMISDYPDRVLAMIPDAGPTSGERSRKKGSTAGSDGNVAGLGSEVQVESL